VVRVLDRKLLRDLQGMRGQVIAILLIVACGVASFVTVLTAYRGLKSSLDAYYGRYRMADLFAPVKRAPRSVARDLERIEGVRHVQARIVFDVTLDLPRLPQPASGRILSVPDRQEPILNDLHLVRGRAFGYSTLDLAAHYLKIALAVGVLGALVGTGLGLWFAQGLGELYRQFFSFPLLALTVDPVAVAGGWAASLVFATAGALGAVRTVARLEPAESMRPEVPRIYHRSLLERMGWLWRRLGFASRMVLRNVARTKLRAAITVGAVALGGSILLLANFSLDSFEYLMDVQFRLAERQDVRVAFHDERGRDALYELLRMEGVRTAEAELVVPVRLRHGWRSRRTGITGVAEGDALHALRDVDLRRIPPPRHGLVLSSKLAELLGGVGERVRVEVLTGEKPRFTVPVEAVVEEYLGTFAYAELGRARVLERVARDAVAVAQRELEQANATLAEAARDLERVRALVRSGSAPDEDMDAVVAAETRAREAARAAEIRVRIRELEIEAAKLETRVLEARLGDRFRVEVRVILDERENAVLVPEGALFRHEDAWHVFRVVDGIAVLTKVETGLRDGRVREVLAGLEPGDRVVLHPEDAVEDGARIEALEG